MLGQRTHRLLGGVTMLAGPTCAERLRSKDEAQHAGWGEATQRLLTGDTVRARATRAAASAANSGGGGGVAAGVDDGVTTVLVVIVVAV
mmetsp:Transcript_17888/g.34896  ORF Transcript_17888/g.34896 Transcript_17888/m.34896 type:complete len:89 (+) Transcript_17888:729-995(+)